MDTITKTRIRCGSWRTFARRFRPVDSPSGTIHWSRDDLPQDADARRVWTILDGGNGKLYVSPGFRFVNRIDYVFCEVPWTDDDQRQPDYVYG